MHENQNKKKEVKPKKILVLGIGIVMAYALMRASVYDATAELGWFATDTMMNVPRLLCLVAAWFVLVRNLGAKEGGLHFANGTVACFVGGIGVLIGFLYNYFRTESFGYEGAHLYILWASSCIVAVFEEILFRGVILTALMGLYRSSVAVVVAAFVFMVFHVQAQPLYYFPALFLHGMVWGTLRCAGVGLGWLIVLHAVFDCVIFLGSHGAYINTWIFPLLLMVQSIYTLAYFQFTFGRINKRDDLLKNEID